MNTKISSVVLAMVAVWLGAYAAQHYMWSAPARVNPLTNFIVLSMLDAQGDTAGTKIYGRDPTPTAAAVPAEDPSTGRSASLYLLENATVHFRVSDEDAAELDNYFTEFRLSFRVYEHGVKNAPLQDNVLLHVVEGGLGQTSIENHTTLQAGIWDLVIAVDYAARPVSSTALGDLIIYIYAEEA